MKKLTRFDLTWAISLFGTAMGAGVLFLPINAGRFGFWPLVLITILAGPMTYYAHQGLARFVLSSSKAGSDITEVAEESFGSHAGLWVTALYFFAIYPILLIYGVGLTNTVESFLINQLGLTPPPRALLSLLLIVPLLGVLLAGQKFMLGVTAWLVYPLCVILFLLSLYLMPHWNLSMPEELPTAGDFVKAIWITIPVLIFSFNHSPAISSFALAQERRYGADAEAESSRTLRFTATFLLVFVMLFVFSCVLSLSPEDLEAARQQNISILSYLANHFDDPFISSFGPLIAFLAITSSFFGHYLGAAEGLRGLIVKLARQQGRQVNEKWMGRGIPLFFLLSLWLTATLNPGILGIIEALSGPVIAAILFLMPMYAIRKVPAMRKYAGSFRNVFVTVMGCVAMSAILYTLTR